MTLNILPRGLSPLNKGDGKNNIEPIPVTPKPTTKKSIDNKVTTDPTAKKPLLEGERDLKKAKVIKRVVGEVVQNIDHRLK